MFTSKVFRGLLLPFVVAAAQFAVPSPAVGGGEEDKGSTSAAEEKQAEPEHPRERRWRMRLIGTIAGNSDGFLETSSFHTHSGVSVDSGGGIGVNFEYRYSPRMGFEIGAMAVGGSVNVGVGKDYRRYGSSVEVNGYLPVTFAFNYHPIKSPEIVDFYLGPLAAFTFLSAVGVGPGVYIESSADLGLGANLGVDINFGRKSRWSFNSGFKYISNVTSNGDRDSRLEFDPLLFTFGFGFKF